LKSEEKITKYLRTPPRNRINFEKILSPYPFKSDWINLMHNWLGEDLKTNNDLELSHNDLIHVTIEMHQRGTPDDFAYICSPLDEDLV